VETKGKERRGWDGMGWDEYILKRNRVYEDRMGCDGIG
jgi:hypothetical protein